MRFGERSCITAAVGFIFFVLALTSDEASAAQYVDPRASMSGYESWCQSVGGTAFNDRRGVGCTPGSGGSSPGSGYSGSNPMTPLMGNMAYEAGRMFGEMLVSLFSPRPSVSPAIEAQRRWREEELRRQQQLWEEWRRQEEERRRREFEEARQWMLGQMRGVEAGSLTLRDPVGSTRLELRMPRDVQSVRFMTSFQRAQCSAYLLYAANKKAEETNFNEAAYLSGQAGVLMGGGPVSASFDVECPPVSASPASVEAAPTKESAAAGREIELRTRLYSALYSRANQQLADFGVVNEAVRGAEAKVEDSKKQKEEAERKLDEVKAKKAQDSEQVPESVLEEALKAYQDSERLLAEAEKDLQTKKESLTDIEAQMRHTKDLFTQAQKPDQIEKILEREFSQVRAEVRQ